MRAGEQGMTVLELVIVVGLILLLAAMAAPSLKAYSQEVHLLGAGRQFLGEFRLARSVALKKGVNTAIRFERRSGGTDVSVYVDGNYNGVLSREIEAGIDRRIAGPRPLDAGAPRVRVGINPGVPAIPPDSGTLETSDPIQFGRSDLLSFSPLGTATPGTFYLAGENAQAAVRVTPGSARVRLMVCRGRKWLER